MVYETWNKGRVDIEPVGNGAIRYCLSYIDKQVFGYNELYETYGDFQPPFALFSKGIGKDWIEKNLDKFDKYGVIKYPSGKSYTLTPYYRDKYEFEHKRYDTIYSDSIIKWATQRHISLSEAYQQRCTIKEVELQRKMIKKREPLYVASKHIIKKDFDNLKTKKEIDEIDCHNFTEKYLKRDDYLLFDKETLSNFH